MSATSEGHLAAPRDNLRARVAGGVAFIGAAQAVKFATQMASVIVLSRILLPADFGTMAMISPLVAFIGVFQGLGLSSAIANAPTITHSQLSTLFWINATMSAALAALVAACAPLMGVFYHQESVVGPTLAMAATILIWGLATLQVGLMNRQMRFRQYAMIDAVASALSIAAAIGIGLLWHNVWALVTSVAADALFTLVGLWFVTGWRPGRPSSIGSVREFLHFGKGVTGFNIANFFARNLDNVLIGKFAGSTELGFYDRAYKLLLFPLQQVNAPVAQVLTPVLSRLADDPERYRSAYVRAIRLMLLVTIPIIVCLLTNAETAIPTLLGQQWTSTVPIFTWLGFSALHQPLTVTTGWLLVSQKRTNELAAWGMFAAATCIVAFIAGLPWGAVGVAAGYTLSDIFIRLPVVFWLVGRRGPIGVRTLCAVAWPNIVANGAAAAVLLMLSQALGFSAFLDLGFRMFCAYAICWTVLALFPSGRRSFGEALRTLKMLRG